MEFFEEVEKLFNLDELKDCFSLHIVGGSCIVVSGFKKIISFSDVEILLKTIDQQTICINGAKMKIKRLEKQEIVISGEFLCVKKSEG